MRDKTKTKGQLIRELQALRKHVTELDQQQAQHAEVETHLKRVANDLSERVKELNCLYRISQLREQPAISMGAILQGIVELIPSALQYPDIACARLTLRGQGYNQVHSTKFLRETEWTMACDVISNDESIGILEVFYLEHNPDMGDEPFLREERKLLEVISERIGGILELHLEKTRIEEQQQQLVQLDKMVALGTLVSGVAHEINNPNNFIMLNAPVLLEAWQGAAPILEGYYEENGDFLLGGLPYSEMRHSVTQLLAGILDGSRRIKSIVENLKRFARVETSELAHGVDINDVVRSAVALLNNQLRKSTEHFSASYATAVPQIRGNFQRLEQVFVNLLQNACEALPDRWRKIEIATAFDKESNRVVITVRDEGVGIPEQILHNIVDPFFTTKRDVGGTGLGLSVSSSIIEHHGGAMSFRSTLNAGTTVEVGLPVPDERHADRQGMR